MVASHDSTLTIDTGVLATRRCIYVSAVGTIQLDGIQSRHIRSAGRNNMRGVTEDSGAGTEVALFVFFALQLLAEDNGQGGAKAGKRVSDETRCFTTFRYEVKLVGRTSRVQMYETTHHARQTCLCEDEPLVY
jgi:hypothetical protein